MFGATSGEAVAEDGGGAARSLSEAWVFRQASGALATRSASRAREGLYMQESGGEVGRSGAVEELVERGRHVLGDVVVPGAAVDLAARGLALVVERIKNGNDARR